jgi:pyroglutamyl-peptidase
MKWLVSAFEPFGGASTNSSLMVLQALRQRDWQGKIEFVESVPVEFGRAWEFLSAQIDPSIEGVLALGQAETRPRISLERQARNWIEARIEDNRGVRPETGRIKSGLEFHAATIPWERFELSEACALSDSAGAFVCNELMYNLMEWSKASGKPAGFVHVPALVSQAEPSFAAGPRMDDAVATAEVARILEFLVKL